MKIEILGEFEYLHEVPFYDQSSQDMHCGYYCAIMLLIATQGKNAWKDWWESKLEPQSGSDASKQLDDGGLEIGTLQDYLTNRGLETRLIQLDSKGSTPLTKCVEKRKYPDFRRDIINALKEGKPSLLRLPHSLHNPYGHYVVVKGYVNASGKRLFIVNDPLVGETSLLMPERVQWQALGASEDDKWGAAALISEKKTHWRERQKQAGEEEARRTK